MSWIRESSNYTLLQKACIFCLKKGMIPRHVAFIMDGNRRYAKKNSLKNVMGHKVGFDKLSETLEWCRDLNILEVSVYAFSIYNFNRESEEVSYLMNMAREKFQNLIDEKEVLMKYNVCVRIIGNLSLLPKDIQQIAKSVMKLTFDNSKFHLNICLAYTSHDEITHSLNQIRWGVQNNLLKKSDIKESLVTACTYLRLSPPVDLVIRTSGEARLSDFLMWQSNDACVKFFAAYWPEFTIWQLFGAVLEYQRNRLMSASVSQRPLVAIGDGGDSEGAARVGEFLARVEARFHDWLFRDVDGFFLEN